MQDVVPISLRGGRGEARSILTRLPDYLPRGNTLDDKAWHRRHRMLQWVLLLHVPGLVALGLLLGHPGATIAQAVAAPVFCLVIGHLVTHRRWASFSVTGGLVFCSAALVVLSRGSIEAHFHFFIIIGFIALYQDWVPFLWNVAFTTLSHGIGTIWLGGQIFNHPAAQQHPWLWSFIHGIAVLFACVGMVIFWRVTEDEQSEKEALGRQLLTADAELNRRQFTADMLVNLARRNQSMLYRQLDIINQLEDKERDPDALADLFKLDHLATRVRRNAESLLVLAGEQTPRTWSAPVALRDVVRAAIAETEDLDRVVFAVDDRAAVSGAAVADLTHLLAELTENAVRFSPPETAVTIRARPNRRDEGGQLLTVEDWGVGMPPHDLAEANDMLAQPREVDLAVSQRLGFHVVARLAARHGITVSLSATPGSGITAVAVLPAALFTTGPVAVATGPAAPVAPVPDDAGAAERDRSTGPVPSQGRKRSRLDAASAVATPSPRRGPGIAVTRNGDAWLPPEPFTAAPGPGGPGGPGGRWRGWWNPEVHGKVQGADGAGLPPLVPTAAGDRTASAYGFAGPGTNGARANGAGTNGAGTNGAGTDGKGHLNNGHGSNEHRGNEHRGNGHDRRPTVNGAGPHGSGADGRGAEGTEPAPAPSPEPTPGPAPARPAPQVPDARREPSVFECLEQRPSVSASAAATGSEPFPAVLHPASPPHGSAGALGLSLPQPRADQPSAGPGRPSHPSGGPVGRGLRRRVPQSHLAPELRHTEGGGLADTAAPLSADSAASALSRYQASRQAAQAVVDTAGPAGPNEGEQR